MEEEDEPRRRIYITSEICERDGGRKKAPRKREELGIHTLKWGVLSPWDIGPSNSVFLAPIWSSPVPKQVVAPSKPNFWTHSLQIHCNGSVRPRSHLSLGPIRKPRPYNYIKRLLLFFFPKCIHRLYNCSQYLSRLFL